MKNVERCDRNFNANYLLLSWQIVASITTFLPLSRAPGITITSNHRDVIPVRGHLQQLRISFQL